ncbi:MAG: hypothetical protein JNM40_19085 [Myxococcales bacterium]|nr:hypothetical protein [Myxococcales bacterium]
MPTLEKRPEDVHAPEPKPVVTPDKWVKKPTADIPWEALAPVPMQHVPLPLQPVPSADKLPSSLFSQPLGMYSDTGFRPMPLMNPVERDKKIDSYQKTLDGATYVAGNLKGQQKVEYIEDQLEALSRFSKDVAPDDATGKAAETVPTPLIDNARPLIEKLERMTPDATTPAGGTNPEGAHVGTGTDWNTKLGVPQYRTQSDNLIPPEASCNMTSLAMALERLGYGRENAMDAIDGELKQRYLDEQKAKLAKTKGDPSTLPKTADDVTLPAGYFEGQVKGYLKAVDAAAEKPYQGVRGKDTDEKAWDNIAGQYRDNAQFEDTLDFLRYLTKAGSRTDLDTVTPKLLEKLEPDAEKRPTYRTITPGKNMDWTKARGQMDEVLDDGGAAMLSFHHKGGNNFNASHIVSVQQMTQDGIVADDPYGRIRSNYNVAQVGDAYGEKGQAGRSPARKNQVDAGLDRSKPSTMDTDWKSYGAQHLKPEEALGSSSQVADSVMKNAWRSLRFLEPAKKKAVVDAAKPAVVPGQSQTAQPQ